jgi:hypothetical protein
MKIENSPGNGVLGVLGVFIANPTCDTENKTGQNTLLLAKAKINHL